jgi:hypothetical protein
MNNIFLIIVVVVAVAAVVKIFIPYAILNLLSLMPHGFINFKINTNNIYLFNLYRYLLFYMISYHIKLSIANDITNFTIYRQENCSVNMVLQPAAYQSALNLVKFRSA